MKYIKILIITVSFFLTACTDVVSVEVPFEGSRLVIEASLDWEKGTLGNEQTIILSLSSPYFNDTNDITYATGASVKVTNTNNGTVFNFEEGFNGEYTTDDFVPIVNNTYALEIVYEDEIYKAEETILALSGINSVEQSLIGGFDKELIDIEVFFNDPVDEQNFYLIVYKEAGDVFPAFDLTSDEFRNGNIISDFYEKRGDEDTGEKPFEAGDVIDIELFAISEGYFDYFDLLFDQTQTGNNPFSAVPVTLKGNCVNTTNPDNSPFGYFRVTESDKVIYTIQ